MKESGTNDLKSKLPFLNKKESKSAEAPEMTEQAEENVMQKNQAWEVIRILGLTVYRLRSLFFAIPVVFAALRLAAYNSEHLPLLVGLDLQSTGEFAKVISRQTAVTIPLLITGGCLLLMCFSRKTLYPWLISVFSLAIPVLLLITNTYPA